MDIWLIRSVSKAICPSIEPVLVTDPPKSPKIVDFFSLVKYDIFEFFKMHPNIYAAYFGSEGMEKFKSN